MVKGPAEITCDFVLEPRMADFCTSQYSTGEQVFPSLAAMGFAKWVLKEQVAEESKPMMASEHQSLCLCMAPLFLDNPSLS